MNSIIVGGGRLGRQLMHRIVDAVVIENEDIRVRELQREFGEERVIKGNGVNESILLQAGVGEHTSLVIATNDDHTNYMIALVAKRMSVHRIIVKVEQPDSIELFERIGVNSVICPAMAAAGMINGELYKDMRRVFELPVMDNSSFRGRELSEIDLPGEAMVVAVMRGQNLMRPADDLQLQRGDHVVLYSLGPLPQEVERIVQGGEQPMTPFRNILVLLRNEGDLRVTLPESVAVVRSVGGSLILASTKEDLLNEGRRLAAEEGVRADERLVPSLEFAMLNHLMAERFPDVECIAISTDPDMRKKGFGPWALGGFLDFVRVPVLICKGTIPYENMVTLLDQSPCASFSADLALRMAIRSEAALTVLTYFEGDEGKDVVADLMHLARLYDVRVIDQGVEGNPTIDFVAEVRSNDHDLVVMNWRCRGLKRNIMRRIVLESPNSVLVVTGTRKTDLDENHYQRLL